MTELNKIYTTLDLSQFSFILLIFQQDIRTWNCAFVPFDIFKEVRYVFNTGPQWGLGISSNQLEFVLASESSGPYVLWVYGIN